MSEPLLLILNITDLGFSKDSELAVNDRILCIASLESGLPSATLNLKG